MERPWIRKPGRSSRSAVNVEALKKQAFQVILYVLGFVILLTAVILLVRWKGKESGGKKELLRYWENSSFVEAFEKSGELLEEKPIDSYVLTIRGFVSYQLALSQINNVDALVYIDECIRSLRRALLKNADKDGRIRYVLGKAYYLKGSDYADLSVRYLEEAKEASYKAADTGEYLGLAYAAVHNYRKSVEELTSLLEPESFGGEHDESSGPEKENAGSDRLLLAIAGSYMGLEEWENARAYLVRCIEESRDTELVLKARLSLGKALRSAEDLSGAIEAFNGILESGVESAEACYELGEIYTAQGETIRARAAYRRAYRADPSYGPALVRF
jgi:tetratricopeptide (TPR) repeat protein